MNPRWRHAAACLDASDPDMFYRDDEDSIREAKHACAHCPVKADCLADALHRREPYGIWGGLTVMERRSLISRERHGMRLERIRRRIQGDGTI